MTMKCKVGIARFPGNHHEDPDTVTWIMKTIREIDKEIALPNGRISEQHMFCMSDTPITMVRNRCVAWAQERGIDLLLMVDNDMLPDFREDPAKPFKPFWSSAFDFLYRKEAPALICSPYVGPDPENNIYVFRWRNSNNYDKDYFRLSQYTREEAAERSGIEKVASIPTGLVLIDMRLFARLPHPYFEYEWNGEKDKCPTCGRAKQYAATNKDSTEDVYFGRNVTNLWFDVPGAGCYVNWDSWSAHIKRTYCRPPRITRTDHMGHLMLEALKRNMASNESVVMLGDDGKEPKPVIQPEEFVDSDDYDIMEQKQNG